MKTTILLLLFISPIVVFSQVTTPSRYLRKSVERIDSANVAEDNTAEASASGTKRKSPVYLLPTVQDIEAIQNEKAQFLQKNIVSYSEDLSNIALYSEIASDFIGPVRVSAGITFAYPKTDTNAVQQQKINRDNFIQKFSTGGGTLAFNFVLPVVDYQGKIASANLSFAQRLSIDPPTFGITSDKFAHNRATGLDLQAELRGVNNVFKFYGNARLSYVAGNGAFYNAIQLEGNNKKSFWLNNYTIGVNIKDIFTLSYTKFWGSKNISEKLSGFLTFTLEPNF
jgi:hypothetical protein